MDPPAGVPPARRTDSVALLRDLDEAIGIALDLTRGMIYGTDLRGSLYRARIDGTERTVLDSGLGSLTGIAFAEVPSLVTPTP